MNITEAHRKKTVALFREIATRDEDFPKNKIDRFLTEIDNELQVSHTAIMGAYRAPGSILAKCLKKSGIAADAITDVVMVFFERNDKIRYFLDGDFHES
jgi:hypothetical protein